MKINIKKSTTATVVVIACATLVVSAALFIFLTNGRLNAMVDNDKLELVNSKMDGIIGLLERKEERLKLTENVEAYQNAFKDTALAEIHKTYYGQTGVKDAWLLYNLSGNRLMYSGDEDYLNFGVPDGILQKIFLSGKGEMEIPVNGEKFWLVFRDFRQWGWFIIYMMPVKEKYAEISVFSAGFLLSGGAAFLAGMLILTFFVYRAMMPVVKLTKATEAITSGNLDASVQSEGENEVAVLAKNFEKMRVSIKEKIRELERVMADLKRSNEDLEQFAYVSSHDLKEPLRIMGLYSELFIKKYGDGLNEDARSILKTIADTSARMMDQIKDILEYSKVGRFEHGLEKVDMREIVEGIMLEYSNAGSKARIICECNSIPIVEGDRTEIKQIFTNLIENGIKYNRSPVPEIKIHMVKMDGVWEISIADNGIGINREFFGKIFEIFEGLHSKEEFQGTGIGLAICKKIVERHGGKIWVESDGEGCGSGSVFKFTISEKQAKKNA